MLALEKYNTIHIYLAQQMCLGMETKTSTLHIKSGKSDDVYVKSSIHAYLSHSLCLLILQCALMMTQTSDCRYACTCTYTS